MSFIKLDLSNSQEEPYQERISKERISKMITWSPRRYRLCDWDKPLKSPGEMFDKQKDWNLIFPFVETFVPTFELMCNDIEHISFRKKEGPSVYTFLKGMSDEKIRKVKDWIELIKPFVAIRDCLALSFALEYVREKGDPNNPQTRVGLLITRAKPYDKPPTSESFQAADELSQLCIEFLEKINCYDYASDVVAIPPRLNKPFDLPTYLAQKIAEKTKRKDLSKHVKTIRLRKEMKNLGIQSKLEAWEGTVEVDSGIFNNKVILLVDDLYQSGVSMNYVAMKLLEAGAKKVFGLACEKTCRNDDNLKGE